MNLSHSLYDSVKLLTQSGENIITGSDQSLPLTHLPYITSHGLPSNQSLHGCQSIHGCQSFQSIQSFQSLPFLPSTQSFQFSQSLPFLPSTQSFQFSQLTPLIQSLPSNQSFHGCQSFQLIQSFQSLPSNQSFQLTQSLPSFHGSHTIDIQSSHFCQSYHLGHSGIYKYHSSIQDQSLILHVVCVSNTIAYFHSSHLGRSFDLLKNHRQFLTFLLLNSLLAIGFIL
jgi:hypothetical protein